MRLGTTGAVRRDFHSAVRSLRRTPRFTGTAILILGFGIAVATAMVSIFQSAVLAKLPVQDQDQLMVLWPTGKGGTEVPLDPADLQVLQASSLTLQSVGGFYHWGAQQATIADRAHPLQVRLSQVTSNFFSVLGARPAAGRLLQPSDRAESDRILVISFATWHRLFGGDSAVVGKQVDWLSAGVRYTIIGVAPPGLDYPIGTDAWTPLWAEAPVDLVARLKPGVSIEAARAELAQVVARHKERTGDRRMTGAFAQSLPVAIYGDVRPALLAMMTGAGLLLLIACTNVGNLLLLRAAGRTTEVAVRRALGAPPSAIIRQSLLESSLLGVAGGLVGLGGAALMIKLFVLAAPRDLPRLDAIQLSGSPLLIGLLVTFATVVFTGLAAVISGSGPKATSALRLDGRGGTETRGRRRIRSGLVVGQVALALIVLDGAGLLTRSLIRLESLRIGYDPDRLTLIQLVPPASVSAAANNSFVPWINLIDRVLPEVRAIPSVAGVSPLVAGPFSGSNTFAGALEAEGAADVGGRTTPIVTFDAVGPDFFATFDLRLVRGRGFTEADRAGTVPVAVVTNSIARMLWPDQDPLGRRVRFAGDTGQRSWRTVVGVADDIHFREFRTATPTIFLEYHQMEFWQGTIAVRTRGDPGVVLPSIREAVQRAAPEMFFWRAYPMSQLLDEPLARPRTNAVLLVGFGLAALGLAGIGLYAVIGSTVKQRNRELGIRMALGAAPARLRRQVLGEALGLVGIGSAIGLLAALAGSRVMTGALFDVSTMDPVALLVAVVVLGLAGVLAAYPLATQATRTDPVRALRAE